MNTRKALPAVVAVALAVLLTACQIVQLDIDFTLRSTGTISEPDSSGQRDVTLKGILACSGGIHSNDEPVDLFVSAKQGNKSIQFMDGLEFCQHTPKIWTQTWDVTVPAGVDLAQPLTVTISACTNPGESIDEDCTQVTESVTLAPVG